MLEIQIEQNFMNIKPYFRTLAVLGAVATTSCVPRSYRELTRTEPTEPTAFFHFIPKGYIPVGYNSCAYRAANVRHEKLSSGSGGVEYYAGETVARYNWGRYARIGCASRVDTVYDPKDPHDSYLKNLKEGDIVHERQLALFSPIDEINYFSGNKAGHELCYPENCPLTLIFRGINGINTVESLDEHGNLKTLWKK